MKKIFLLGALLFLPFISQASSYKIDYDNSTVKFSGEHVGNKFEGKFEKWNGVIIFDKDDLQNSKIEANFKTSSAKTGDAMYDGTLPQKDWFNSKTYELAEFKSAEITALQAGSYKAKGILKIRDIENIVDFIFTINDVDAAPKTKARGQFIIDRLIYDIGRKSDPKSEWVSKNIDVELNILAIKE